MLALIKTSILSAYSALYGGVCMVALPHVAEGLLAYRADDVVSLIFVAAFGSQETIFMELEQRIAAQKAKV